MGPNDPVFFDPDADVPTPIFAEPFNARIVDAMKRAGIRPEIIYAFEKTGVLMTEGNQHLWSPEDQKACDAALAEFQARRPQ